MLPHDPLATAFLLVETVKTGGPVMTAREVAALLEVPISTVLEWGRNCTLPRVKRGRHVRFIRAHVEAAILDSERPRRP
jgi:excisionase family DNA binding protein